VQKTHSYQLVVAVGSIAEVCCDRTERDGDVTVIYSLSWWVVLKVVVMRTSYTEVAHPRYCDVAGRAANLVSPPCSMAPFGPHQYRQNCLLMGV